MLTRRQAGAMFLAAQPARYAVIRSVDGGRTWMEAHGGLPGGVRVNALLWRGGECFAGTDAGVFVSRDEGRNWRAWLAGARVLSLTGVGEVLLAGTDKEGVLASGGGRGLAGESIRCLAVDTGRVYAGTGAGNVFVSGDQGKSWAGMRGRLPPRAQVFALAVVRGKLFAGLYAKGLYAWADRTWLKRGTVAPLVLSASGDTLVAGQNPGGIHWSSDFGVNWRLAGGAVPPLAPVWEMGAGGGLIVAGVAKGIYCSRDQGRNWTLVREGAGVAFAVREEMVLAALVL